MHSQIAAKRTLGTFQESKVIALMEINKNALDMDLVIRKVSLRRGHLIQTIRVGEVRQVAVVNRSHPTNKQMFL